MRAHGDNAAWSDGGHPNRGLLRKFINGRLDEAQSRGIETHLEACPSCCGSLADLSFQNDRFVQDVVAAISSNPPAGPDTDAEQANRDPVDRADPPQGFPGRDAHLPKRIGRFEIRGLIGEGAFGSVLRGYDPHLQRDAAIKIPRIGAILTADLSKRFLREAQAAAALDHPNIVPLYEAREDSGFFYIATAYCRGPTLSEWLHRRQEPVAIHTAAWLIAILACAVHHAHCRGVLHRDLKPSNVLLAFRHEDDSASGSLPEPGRLGSPRATPRSGGAGFPFVPKIVDFGLAKLVGGGSDATQVGVAMGTASYMPPEQARGSSQQIGPTSDVYALGAILYELLVGRPPIVGESELDTIQRVQEDDPVPPSRFRSKLPRDLETICLACLRKEPQRRYASAQALADDLQHFLNGEPIRTRAVGRLEQAARWCRRHPAVATLAASIAGLLLIMAAVSFGFALQLREREVAARKHLGRALIAERDRTRALGRSYLDQATALRHSRRQGQRFEALQILARAADLAPRLELGPEEILELRSAAAACLALPDLRLQCRWPAYPPEAHGLGIAFDADVTRYARLEPDGQIAIRRLEDNRILLRLPGTGSLRHTPLLRFSPDKQFLAVKDDQDGKAIVWSLETQSPVWEHGGAPGTFRQDVDFSPNSRKVALGRTDGSIQLYDLQAGVARQCVPPGGLVQHVRFHPDGTRLAFFRGTDVVVAEVSSGATLHRLQAGNSGVQSLCWSPDGRHLAYSYHVPERSEHLVCLYDSIRGTQTAVLDGHQLAVIRTAYSAGGGLVATTSWDGTTRLWDAATGRELLACLGSAVRFSRDGRWLAFGHLGHAVGRWEMALARACRRFAPPSRTALDQASVGPQGRVAASGAADGVHLWEIATARELAHIPLGMSSAKFDPVSGQLVTSSPAGVHRWPVQRDSNSTTDVLQIGPPQRIDSLSRPSVGPPALCATRPLLAALESPNSVAVIEWNGNHPPEIRRISPVSGQPAVSPDGRWVATSTWHGSEVQVFDARTGNSVGRLATIGGVIAEFSPDGRWLVGGTGREYRFWEVGSWELDHIVPRAHVGDPGEMAFTRDGRIMAISHSAEAIALINPSTGREFVRLPAAGPNVWFCFSPNGSHLLTAGEESTIDIWDLGRIRDQLARAGLDWNLPPTALASPAGRVRPVEIRLDFGDVSELLFQYAAHRARQHDYEQAVANYRKLLASIPDHAAACNNLAWILVNGPTENRHPDEALTLALRAVALRPHDGNALNTLGVVYYRLGRFDEAVRTLHAAGEHNPDGPTAWDEFFLSMCYARQGDVHRAHASYVRAMRWWAARRQLTAEEIRELESARAEVEPLLLHRQDEKLESAGTQ